MSHHPKFEFQQTALHKGLQSDLKLPNARTLAALHQSELVLARFRAGVKPRFDTLEKYFETMERKVAHPKPLDRPSE